MTTITFTRTGFKADGHAGFGESGSDIVCAGISAILQAGILGIKKITPDIKVEKRDGSLILTLPSNLDLKLLDKCGIVLDTMYLGIIDLSKQYPKHISLKGELR